MRENKPKLLLPHRPLMIGIVAVSLGLFGAIALANQLKARYLEAIKNTCIDNLRQLDGGKAQWALENNPTNLEATVDWMTLQPYLGRCGDLTTIYCPADSTKQFSNSYILGNMQTKPKCNINPAAHSIN